jgi:hypothetical protein
MIVTDIRDAVVAAVTSKVTVLVTSTGIPTGQTAFNPGETVTYSLKVTNAVDGGQLNNVRLHVFVSDASELKLIVPPTATATAYQAATGTAVYTAGSEQSVMFLSTTALPVLSPGETVTISNLTVKGVAVGSPSISAHIHADVDMAWLFPTNNGGTIGSKAFNIVT